MIKGLSSSDIYLLSGMWFLNNDAKVAGIICCVGAIVEAIALAKKDKQ